MNTVVYVDVLIFTNILINYCILNTVARLMHLRSRLWRVILASFLSSLSALCVYLPFYTGIVSFVIRIAICAITALLAFFSGDIREYLKSTVLMITVSILYCGFFIAVYELFKPPNMAVINDIVYFEFNPIVMIVITSLIYLILLLIRKLLHKRISNTIVNLSFAYQNHTYSCLGKVDTACSATEPFSGDPVIITDKSVFDTADLMNKRVIPCKTLSGSSLLYAVKCDELIIDHKEIKKSVYIGSADIAESSFQAIINSDIVR